MEKFILNITASSGEFYQGYCESLTLPTGDGVKAQPIILVSRLPIN